MATTEVSVDECDPTGEEVLYEMLRICQRSRNPEFWFDSIGTDRSLALRFQLDIIRAREAAETKWPKRPRRN